MCLLLSSTAHGATSEPLDRLVLEERFSAAFGEAVHALRRSLATNGYRSEETLDALQRVGVVAHLAGDQGTAEEVLRTVVAARRLARRPADASQVEALLILGRAARYRNERAWARQCYEDAERLLAQMAHPPPELRGQLLQAQADWLRGVDLGQAIAAYRAGVAVRRTSAPSFGLVDNLTWLAWTLHRAGELDEARDLTLEAAAGLDRLGLSGHSLRGTLENLLGENLAIRGDLHAATAFFRRTVAMSESARVKQLGGFSRRLFPLDGYEPLALEALSRGRSEEAWTLLEHARAASHVDFATLAGWERRDPSGWQSWQDLRRRMREIRRRLPAESSFPAAWTQENAPLCVELLELRARARDLERRYLAAFRPGVPTLQEVQALLGPREALVGWLDVNFGGDPSATTAPQRSRGWGYVLRRDRPIAWVSLWDTRTPDAYRAQFSDVPIFESLRRAASWRRRVDADPQMAAQMRAWTRTVVDPLLPHLAGVNHLVMERLQEPLELAVLPDGRMLGDVFDVSYVPSAVVYGLLAAEGPRRDRSRAVLAVSGVSDSPPSTAIASLVDFQEGARSQRQLRTSYLRTDTPLDRLPKLRHAALEARAVGARFPERVVLLDAGVSDRSLDELARRDQLRRFAVVHIAAHTLADSAPEHCALALGSGRERPHEGDGVVEVEDILDWHLDADLMTLSGCETMRAGGAGRGEPLGFTPAVFASGARRVLSSIWTVDDRATTILMDRFYENLTGEFTGDRLGYRAAPMPPARALREAKIYVRTLKAADGHRPFEHPAYWAGFLLVGLP